MMAERKVYHGSATLVCGQDLGTFEAASEQEAYTHFEKKAGVSLCHHCGKKLGDLEVEEIHVEVEE